MALAERAYFALCSALGRALRSARYSDVRTIDRDGQDRIWKRRRFYAPALIALGDPLMRILDTGVRVLPDAEWRERERRVARLLHRDPVGVVGGGAQLQQRLPGVSLAKLLEDASLDEDVRGSAITAATNALAGLHRLGVTHGDAMAENVLIDRDTGAAHWIDFETLHEPARAEVWRRADDVRALLSTCLVRTAPDARATTLRRILQTYGDDAVTRVLATTFASVLLRPLTLHLGQAPLSFDAHREIAQLLRGSVAAKESLEDEAAARTRDDE